MNAASLLAAKEHLASSTTVITQRDGSRYLEQKDGTLTSLPPDTQDEDGNFAVLDEKAALGLSSDQQNESDGSVALPQTIAGKKPWESKKMLGVLSKHAAISPYLKLLKIGAPLGMIRSRVAIDTENGKISKEAGEEFLQVVLTEDLGQDDNEDDSAVENANHFADSSEAHGHLGDPSWALPRVAVRCDAEARAGYNSAKGHEYLESDEVLRAKVRLLANLIRASRVPVFYAGAGLSTASGIGDYATQTGSAGVVATQRMKEKGAPQTQVSPFCAKPNLGHRVMAALGREGHLFRFIQQNHDGLPQKAGMPQHLLNEIHGAWFDPSNPVVAMSGNLRSDLFDDLLECERRADLVVAVGSSLCGMNADRLVVTSARRSRLQRSRIDPSEEPVPGDHAPSQLKTTRASLGSSPPEGMTQFGSVIISLQKTVHDHNSSLRIFALLDDVFRLLAEEMQLDVSGGAGDAATAAAAEATAIMESHAIQPNDHVFSVPYDAAGQRTEDAKTILDLREGAALVVTGGPDKGAAATVIGLNRDGHYRISIERHFKRTGSRFKETRLLGSWWPAAAVSGSVKSIPVVTASPPVAE